jgi:hypothetical protein
MRDAKARGQASMSVRCPCKSVHVHVSKCYTKCTSISFRFGGLGCNVARVCVDACGCEFVH